MALTLIVLCPFLPLYANLRSRCFYRSRDWSVEITWVRDYGMNDCDNSFTPLRKREILLLRFSGVTMMSRRENTEPTLDQFCPI